MTLSLDFLRWNSFREREEGGWSNDPKDAGGATKWGISKAAHPSIDIASLTREQASEIAKREYWDIVDGDRLPWPVSLVMADWAFHAGPDRATRGLQAEVDAGVDGKLGEETLLRVWAVANEKGPQALAEVLHLRRTDSLVELCLGKASQLKFLKGWMRRCVRLAYLMEG